MKLIEETTLLLIYIGLGTSFGLVIPNESRLSNSLHADINSYAKCEDIIAAATRADRDTIAEDPPRLTGKWVSSGCEVRSGPEFLLRSYSFHKNQTFRLTQFHYGDESCTLPLYTIIAKGRYRIRGHSWVTPGATEAEYTLIRVTVIAFNMEMASEIALRVNSTCPGRVRRQWRPYREYTLLNLPEEEEGFERIIDNRAPHHVTTFQRKNPGGSSLGKHSFRLMMSNDIDCLSALHAVFHELQLLRVLHRPPGPPGRKHPQKELLLGDIHSHPELRSSYRPTAFQTALLYLNEAHDCPVCHLIGRATDRSPPHLHAKPRLPAYLAGYWVSPRCESRPLGLFLTRKFKFITGERSWIGEYKFFSDPFCRIPTFSATASGWYSGSEIPSSPGGGSELDFRVERASLTLMDKGMAANLQGDTRCSVGGAWKVGVPRDLTPTRGCAPLGIKLPSIEYELVKVEINEMGFPLLLMGQPDTDNRRRGSRDRSTAYQLPLVQCSTNHLLEEENVLPNHIQQLVPLPLLSSSSCGKNHCSNLLLFNILILSGTIRLFSN